MSGVLKLIRPINCFMGAIAVILGALVGVGLDVFSTKYLFQILVGCAIVYFFMAAGNMMNDYFDRDLDKINHPERPIPAGILQSKDVLVAAVSIYGLLIILGLLINWMMLGILIIALVLMIGYEVSLKNRGFIGNITISLLVALLFLFGAAAVVTFNVVLILSLLAFLATLTREIVKDIEDIAGDVNRLTLPKKIGIKNASILAGIVLIFAVVISPIPMFPELLPSYFIKFTKLSIFYIYIISLADLLFIISILFFAKKPHIASQVLKSGMVYALIAFALGSISL